MSAFWKLVLELGHRAQYSNNVEFENGTRSFGDRIPEIIKEARLRGFDYRTHPWILGIELGFLESIFSYKSGSS